MSNSLSPGLIDKVRRRSSILSGSKDSKGNAKIPKVNMTTIAKALEKEKKKKAQFDKGKVKKNLIFSGRSASRFACRQCSPWWAG